MKKYIYARNAAELLFENLQNSFLDLCMILGAYIKAKQLYVPGVRVTEKELTGFLEDNNYVYGNTVYWSWLNAAYRFLRDEIGEPDTISKNMIKKIGHSGFGTVPKYPIKGSLVVHLLYSLLLSEEYQAVRKVYLERLENHWEYGDNGSLDEEEVASQYMGFQNEVLREHARLMHVLFHDDFFVYLHEQLSGGDG